MEKVWVPKTTHYLIFIVKMYTLRSWFVLALKLQKWGNIKPEISPRIATGYTRSKGTIMSTNRVHMQGKICTFPACFSHHFMSSVLHSD